MKRATVIMELFDSGIHLLCEETETDVFIEHGNGNKLMDTLNSIYDDTDPTATYSLTEKGEEVLELINKFPSLTIDEADKIISKKRKNKKEKR